MKTVAKQAWTVADAKALVKGEWLWVRFGCGGRQMALVMSPADSDGSVMVLKFRSRSASWTRPVRVSLWETQGKVESGELVRLGRPLNAAVMVDDIRARQKAEKKRRSENGVTQKRVGGAA